MTTAVATSAVTTVLATSVATIVVTVTGHGLKDPQWALRGADGEDVTPRTVPFDVVTVAQALGLA